MEKYFLKCDNSTCDHVEFVDEISADMIGKACPKCGENLLTQEDHDGFVEAISAINDMANIDSNESDLQVEMTVNYHKNKLSLDINPVGEKE